MVPVASDKRNVTWPNGDVFEVSHFRCLACGSREIVERDWMRKHEKDESVEGRYMESDGRQIHARLLRRGGGLDG